MLYKLDALLSPQRSFCSKEYLPEKSCYLVTDPTIRRSRLQRCHKESMPDAIRAYRMQSSKVGYLVSMQQSLDR